MTIQDEFLHSLVTLLDNNALYYLLGVTSRDGWRCVPSVFAGKSGDDGDCFLAALVFKSPGDTCCLDVTALDADWVGCSL